MLRRLDLSLELLALVRRDHRNARRLNFHVLDVFHTPQVWDDRHGLRGLWLWNLANRLRWKRRRRLEGVRDAEVRVLLQRRLVAQHEAPPHSLLQVELPQQLLVVVHELETLALQQLDLLLQIVLLQLLVLDQLLEEQAELVLHQCLEYHLRRRDRLRPREVRVDPEIRHRLLHLRQRRRRELRQDLRLGRGRLHRQLHRLLLDRVCVTLQLLGKVPQVIQFVLRHQELNVGLLYENVYNLLQLVVLRSCYALVDCALRRALLVLRDGGHGRFYVVLCQLKLGERTLDFWRLPVEADH